MAALGQTISRVAHELNNPLGTIMIVGGAAGRTAGRQKSSYGLEVILGEAERAARIVGNLLTFAHKRQSTRMMVDLNEIDSRNARAPRPRTERLEYRRRVCARRPLPEIFADGHQVKQVLLNLVINAEHAMLASHGRGSLVIRTWQEPDASRSCSRSGTMARDSGGVAAAVFDPFFTTKEAGKGTGLGLSVAYAIVQEHGGRIWLSSTKGQGASFYVELPIVGEALQPRKTAAGADLTRAIQGTEGAGGGG